MKNIIIEIEKQLMLQFFFVKQIIYCRPKHFVDTKFHHAPFSSKSVRTGSTATPEHV